MKVLDKPVHRIVHTRAFSETLVATFTPEGLLLRPKGTRTTLGPLCWGWLYLKAAELTANAKRAERKTARPAKRVRRGEALH